MDMGELVGVPVDVEAALALRDHAKRQARIRAEDGEAASAAYWTRLAGALDNAVDDGVAVVSREERVSLRILAQIGQEALTGFLDAMAQQDELNQLLSASSPE